MEEGFQIKYFFYNCNNNKFRKLKLFVLCWLTIKMNFFECHSLELLLPKQHVLDDIDIHYQKRNARVSQPIETNQNLINLFNHSTPLDFFLTSHIYKSQWLFSQSFNSWRNSSFFSNNATPKQRNHTRTDIKRIREDVPETKIFTLLF